MKKGFTRRFYRHFLRGLCHAGNLVDKALDEDEDATMDATQRILAWNHAYWSVLIERVGIYHGPK
jgi:hypothetical protein